MHDFFDRKLLFFLFFLDDIFNFSVYVQHLQFSRGKRLLKHTQNFFHGGYMVENGSNEIVPVLMYQKFLLNNAQMHEMQTVKEKNHSPWDISTHSDFDVWACVKRTARIHDEDADSSEQDIEKYQEDKCAQYDRPCDQFKQSYEEQYKEYQTGAEYDFPSSLIPE